MPQLDEVPSSKSVFIDDPKFGKDPFFPKTKRREPVIPVAQINSTPESAFAAILPSIVLKGTSGLPGRRLALINNRTLQAGEDCDIKIGSQSFKIRLLEVRDRSVVVGMEGTAETKEIRMRAGLQ